MNSIYPEAPVCLGFHAAEVSETAVIRLEVHYLQRLADHVVDFVVKRLDVDVQTDPVECAVIPQLPRAHFLLLKVARAFGQGPQRR